MELTAHWQSCIEAFIRGFSRSGSADSARMYRSRLDLFFRTLHRSSPEYATRADIEDFIWMPNVEGKRNAGARPKAATRNNRLATISSFYKFASDYVPEGQYVPLFTGRLPTTGIKHAIPDRAYHGMSQEDLQRFFSVIDRSQLIGKRDYAVFVTLYLTARRLREILDLRYGDVTYETIQDKEERRQAWVYHFYGKGHKTQRDSAELSLVAKQAIDEYLEASGRLPLAPDDPLFIYTSERVDTDPYKPISSSVVEKRFKLYCGYAGLDTRRLTPHSLRHSSSQHRLQNGMPLMDLSRVLRHHNLDTTKIYAQGLLSEADPGLRGLERGFL